MLARDDNLTLKRTPLHALHVARGGKMVPFAGYDMPVQYAAGVLQGTPAYPQRRRPVRRLAYGPDRAARRNPARSRTPRWRWSGWCRRTSSAVAPGRQRYAQFTNDDGGILDDLMVANFGDHLFLVVNAACKAEDEAHLRAHLSDVCEIEPLPDRALIALQGPKAESALAKFCADVAAMRFMDAGPAPGRRHRLLRLALRLYRRGRV